MSHRPVNMPCFMGLAGQALRVTVTPRVHRVAGLNVATKMIAA